MNSKWYETHDNLVGLAYWLNSEACYFADASAVIYYFSKPWKWTREYGLWRLWDETDSVKVSERCIEAIDEETTAEQILAELEEEQCR